MQDLRSDEAAKSSCDAMKFTIEGEGFRVPGEDPPRAKKAKAALDALPLGKLWTFAKVAEAAGISESQASKYMRSGFENHRVKSGFRFLYGSPKTISLWRKEQAKLASAKH